MADLILYHSGGFFQWSLCVKNVRSGQCFISEIFVVNQLTLGSAVTAGEGCWCSRAAVPAALPATESPLLLEVAPGPGQSKVFSKSQ